MQQIDTSIAAKQSEFFRRLFGGQDGWLNIATKGDRFRDRWYHYPDQLEEATVFVVSSFPSKDVYFCPNLYTVQKRSKEHIRQVACAWADLDTCGPSELLVKPSFVTESSPGRYQAMWVFDEPQDMITGEDISHRIAYYHKSSGADTSGWDSTQLLRVPFTINHKPSRRTREDLRPSVKIITATTARYRPSDFDVYPPFPSGPKTLPEDVPQPPPDLTGDQVMAKYDGQLSDYAQLLFKIEPTEDWSRALWNLECLLLEAGATTLETYVVARDSACNKYERDGKPAIGLWKEIHKADEHVRSKIAQLAVEVEPPQPLLRDHERTTYSTIIEKYTEWAGRQTDASPSFHQASAFMLLSALLAGRLRLQMMHGTYIPNLWFMVLGNTTLTRKSTAMRLASNILGEISPETIMATDGSIEGILSAIGTRPGEASIFQRDEFSGFLEAMRKKDYMAGTQQEFLKLYDGDMIKRRLRSGDITVRDPIFILFAGGIRDRILGLLDEAHVESGFVPRFLFFLGEADRGSRRRAKLFSPDDLQERDHLIHEFSELHNAFHTEQNLRIGHASTPKKKLWFATMTDEALERWNDLNDELIDYAHQSERPDLFYPVVQRLADSLLKASLLLAAARAPGEAVVITLEDVLHAIHYGEQWFFWSVEVIRNVGKTPYEEKLAKIHDYIYRNPGVPLALVTKTFKLNVQNTKLYIDTLEQRGMIKSFTRNKTKVFFSEASG